MRECKWETIAEHIRDDDIDLNSRVVIKDSNGKELFCELQWIKEEGYDRPLLIIEDQFYGAMR